MPALCQSISMIPRSPWALHDRVRVLELVGAAGAVVAEELTVEVERVDEVELGEVRQVDPERLRSPHPDRVLGVVEGPAVDRVEVVLAVPVRVVAVHHHHELVSGSPRLGRVDDERAVEALVDVLLQRRRVAVVQLHAVGARREAVGEASRPGPRPRRPRPCPDGWMPWKWIVWGCEPAVDERDLEDVVLGGADDRAGNGAVVGPGREGHPLGHLDVAVDGHQVVPADPPGAVRQGRGREQQAVEVVRPAGSRDRGADHRGVAVARAGGSRRARRGGRAARQRGGRGEAGHREGREHGRGAHEHLTARQTFPSHGLLVDLVLASFKE